VSVRWDKEDVEDVKSGISPRRFQRTIGPPPSSGKGARLIVGVSAGVDSMVLLYLLHALRRPFDLELIVAHVNHGFRPDEAEKSGTGPQRVRKDWASFLNMGDLM